MLRIGDECKLRHIFFLPLWNFQSDNEVRINLLVFLICRYRLLLIFHRISTSFRYGLNRFSKNNFVYMFILDIFPLVIILLYFFLNNCINTISDYSVDKLIEIWFVLSLLHEVVCVPNHSFFLIRNDGYDMIRPAGEIIRQI